MSISPEKLKQYISLKEAALTLRPDFAVDCNDPKPESETATVSVVLPTPFIGLDRTKTAIASLFTFCDTFFSSSGTKLIKPLVEPKYNLC